MASAMILKYAYRMLGKSPKIEFLDHNTQAHKQAGFDICGDPNCELALFCDIAPHEDTAFALHGHAIVLDHHKGEKGKTERLVKSFGELGVFADEKLEPGVSGAMLAFLEVWRACCDSKISKAVFEPIYDFARCVGVRDTWQTNDPWFPRGQWISKMLMSKPASWWLGDGQRFAEDRSYGFRPYLTENETQAGRVLFEAHEEAVRQAVGQLVVVPMKDVVLLIFQEQATGFRLCSDLAEHIRKGVGMDPSPALGAILAGFSYFVPKPGEEPRLTYSLRTIDGAFNVADFAAANGGGGHTKAAGFSVDIKHANIDGPYKDITNRLVEFLQSEKK